MSLSDLCQELHNYFVVPEGVHEGEYTISGGVISPVDFLVNDQYYFVSGSVFNDGVYKYPQSGATDETFNGAVWAMAVPPAVIALNTEIEAYAASDAAKITPFQSESFNGYSYSRATGADGNPVSDWRTVFRSRLNKWRKI